MSDFTTPASPIVPDRTRSAPDGCTEPALGALLVQCGDNLAAIEDCELRRLVLWHAAHDCDACFARGLDRALARLTPEPAPGRTPG